MGTSFEPRGKENILADLDEALDESIDEFQEEEGVVQRLEGDDALMRTQEGRRILGNQITIMEALKYIMTEMWVQNGKDIG